MNTRTVVEILDKSLDKVGEIKNLVPINNQGMVLSYSRELSDFGQCRFRVNTNDPFLTQFGDLLEPHTYHIRIKRGGDKVWQGAIVDNPTRNKTYIEVIALEYEFYLDKVLIRRDAETVPGDGKDNYRTFSSGTMAAAVTDLIDKAALDFGANHPLGSMITGVIDNPNYPDGFADANGVALTGGWNFSDFVSLQFDYHSVLYVLKAFGLYTNTDFEVNPSLEFNFETFLGNKSNRLAFRYGTFGNVVDYNIPRLGRRMANDVWGIAADSDGKVLHIDQRDEDSIQTRGLLQEAKAFTDVKDLNMLKTRINEELQFTKTPDYAPVNIILNEKGFPVGQFDIGDIVRVDIEDHNISYSQPRRVVGYTVMLHNTGREMVTVQTNRPRDADIGV